MVVLKRPDCTRISDTLGTATAEHQLCNRRRRQRQIDATFVVTAERYLAFAGFVQKQRFYRLVRYEGLRRRIDN